MVWCSRLPERARPREPALHRRRALFGVRVVGIAELLAQVRLLAAARRRQGEAQVDADDRPPRPGSRTRRPGRCRSAWSPCRADGACSDTGRTLRHLAALLEVAGGPQRGAARRSSAMHRARHPRGPGRRGQPQHQRGQHEAQGHAKPRQQPRHRRRGSLASPSRRSAAASTSSMRCSRCTARRAGTAACGGSGTAPPARSPRRPDPRARCARARWARTSPRGAPPWRRRCAAARYRPRPRAPRRA